MSFDIFRCTFLVSMVNYKREDGGRMRDPWMALASHLSFLLSKGFCIFNRSCLHTSLKILVVLVSSDGLYVEVQTMHICIYAAIYVCVHVCI